MTPEEIRKSLGLSQTDFAELLGLKLRTYTYRLKGSFPFLSTELLTMSKLGNCDVEIKIGDETYTVKLNKIEIDNI